VGRERRALDGVICDTLALKALAYEACRIPALDQAYETCRTHPLDGVLQYARKHQGLLEFKDEPAEELARDAFFAAPFFRADGTRATTIDSRPATFFAGAFNPPHAGHFGMMEEVCRHLTKPPLFEISTDAPHKPALAVADMLQRAKMLKGHGRIFTEHCPLYLDKARKYHGSSFVIGADAFLRMFDPKWCPDPKAMIQEFLLYEAKFHLFGRYIDGRYVSPYDVMDKVGEGRRLVHLLLSGEDWNLSSSEIRKAG
jgi:Cytidylyltransferase-like